MATLRETFTNIADAIRTKSGKSDLMTPLEMPTEITNLPSGGFDFIEWHAKNITASVGASYGFDYLFYSMKGIKEIPTEIISNLQSISNNDKLESIFSMFRSCSNLLEIPYFNTSKVTKANNAFMGCTLITSLPDFDFTNVTDITNIFYECKNLESISNITWGNKITDFSSAFYKCNNINIDFKFDTSAVTSYYGIYDTFGTVSGNTSYYLNNQTIIPFTNVKFGIDLRNLVNVPMDAWVDFFTNDILQTSATGTQATFKIPATILNTLSKEVKQSVIDKGYTLARA